MDILYFFFVSWTAVKFCRPAKRKELIKNSQLTFFNVYYQIAIICTKLYIPKNYSKKYTFKKKKIKFG